MDVFSVSDECVYNPDISVLQKVQLILDLRTASLLQSYLGPRQNITSQECLFKICSRALSLCLSVPVSLQECEPFISLGYEFSSCEWVHGIVESMRDVKSMPINSECFQLGIKCLFLMSVRTSWLRSWPMCDVLSFLLVVKKRLLRLHTVEAMYMKKLTVQILRQLSINKHSYVSAAVSMRLLSSGLEASLLQKDEKGETVLDTACPQPIQSLLLEAQDMSFGSTLAEQRLFTAELLKWLHFAFPESSPIIGGKRLSPMVEPNHLDMFWKSGGELIRIMMQWMPAMLLPLEVEDSIDKDRKQRAKDSASVIIKQVTVIERILLYAMVADDANNVGLVSMVVNAMWHKPSTEEESTDEINSIHQSGEETAGKFTRRETGLLFLLQQIDVTVVLSEHFLCTKVYMHIVAAVVRLMKICNTEELEMLCNLGTISACLQFILHGIGVIRSIVPRASLHAAFKLLYPSLVNTMRSVWEFCLSSRSPVVYDAVVNSNIVRVLVEEWIPDTSNIGLKSARGVVDSIDFQPLMVRFEAALMLRIVNDNPVEKVVYELSSRAASAATVKKEMMKMKSTSTKLGASLARSSAVTILATLAQFNAELINVDLQVSHPSLSYIYTL